MMHFKLESLTSFLLFSPFPPLPPLFHLPSPSPTCISPLPLCFFSSFFPTFSSFGFLLCFEWWKSMLFHSKVLHANTSLYSAFVVTFGYRYQPSQLGEQVLCYKCPIYLHFKH